jgi:hypothetical protein
LSRDCRADLVDSSNVLANVKKERNVWNSTVFAAAAGALAAATAIDDLDFYNEGCRPPTQHLRDAGRKRRQRASRGGLKEGGLPYRECREVL